MCGIAGWFKHSTLNQAFNKNDATSTLNSMIMAIKHRGPDGQGIFLTEQIGLGHVRLSIIDLESGQQPMSSYDDTIVISFNGEIYNYQELRQQLKGQGYPFKTHSDTEVIIAIYQSKGITGFNLLRGMFAFVLWDKKSGSAFLVRDPSGIKPLFIAINQQQLLFGSEAKAILAHPDYHAELSTSSLHALMNFRYLPAEQSLFKGIKQLSPGEILHWRIDGTISHSKILFAEPARTDILSALEDSVRAHFTADVEVACYLSGGIDSAAICALGQKSLTNDKPLQTFTLEAGDDPHEANYAQRSAQILNLVNHRKAILFNPEKSLAEMLWHLEVPKINSLQIKLLAQFAASKVKVCLSGLGGDEAFYGYNVHRFMHQAQQLSRFLPGVTHRIAGLVGEKLSQFLSAAPYSETSRKFGIVKHLSCWPKVYALMRNIWDSPKLRQQIYGQRMLDSSLPDCHQLLENIWPTNADPVTALAEFESRHKMVNDLLWQEDRMSMACGLEVRVPFVDQPLISSVQQLNRQQLMIAGKPKSFLKELLQPLLGKEIIQRRKSGFQVSSPDFYHQHLSSMAEQWLSPDKVTTYGLFNPDFIKKILRLKPTKKLRWHYFILYLMLLTHIWLELFENGIHHSECQTHAT
ncbi:Asparagine synthetase [glutamine-hydrolyzing] [hydrothermal vent metagenome]|uniref:Asparagine synthetase [glutamine-hydrolyzing] n=1 Tax=hydrothermal vent metagenome TaxID=652676 RepID=A0A3B0YAG5_9ZZZZ